MIGIVCATPVTTDTARRFPVKELLASEEYAQPPCHVILLHLTSSEDHPILFPPLHALLSVSYLIVCSGFERGPVSGKPGGLGQLQYDRWKGSRI